MMSQKYSVNQHLIETVLSWVKSGEVAIPEIQRPFVWDASKVRDLMDSLYQGFPVGYVIAWRNPTVKLKDGSLAEGKKVLIDGQQRVTALTAAITGQQVVNQNYQCVRIRIAFHPIEERFEVSNPAIEKDKAWFPDIAPIVNGELKVHKVGRDYLEFNPDVDEDLLYDRLDKLCEITKKQIGLIELAADLDIETVTEIFIRINSKGVVLSQADFAMSKIAANEEFNGNMLRKAIDYFCHLSIAPEFYTQIENNDKAFVQSDYFRAMRWLRSENDDLYDPSYSDMLRVAFTTKFNRGRLSDLVGLLSGRNFETRSYEKEIEEKSFRTLGEGVMEFINEIHFKRFLMIIRSAGYVDSSMIGSINVLNFAYVLYLKLKRDLGNNPNIEGWIRRWFVMSLLTGRYSGSPESRFDKDIKAVNDRHIAEVLQEIETAELSDAFWDFGLPQALTTSSINAPAIKVFWAAQAHRGDKGFLSKDITVRDMLTHHGDIHHIFPRNFLKNQGLEKGKYNQVANYVYVQQEVNIKVGDTAPAVYMADVFSQCESGEPRYGAITCLEALKANLSANCLPEALDAYKPENFEVFLAMRRKLMAQKIKHYYWSL
ncbi:GmrSD restriction endonuclease domain-containing protein [Methylobacillus pratensis]